MNAGNLMARNYLQSYVNETNDWNRYWSALSTLNCQETHQDSAWVRLENAFNGICKKILVSFPIRPHLLLVLDDDKVHAESKTQGVWGSIKKVKHVVCNRFGLNIHTLASSCTGLIYGVRTERHDDTTSSCVKKILSFLFKGKDQDNPDLSHIIVSLDRGYGGCKSLINWIVGFFGNVVGTMKRTLWAPITWDAKKYNPKDERIFETSSGIRYVKRMIIALKEGTKSFGCLSALFYRNGFGGACMLQSTVAAHRREIWDRIEDNRFCHRKIDKDDPTTFLLQISNTVGLMSSKRFLATYLQNKAKFITTHQNVHEWFVMRMFCLTASSSAKIFKNLATDDILSTLDHWKELSKYYSRNIPAIPTVDLEYSDDEFWASVMIEDEDSWAWLACMENINELERSKIEALQMAISKVTGRKVTTKKVVAAFFDLPPEERVYISLNATVLKKRLRDLLPKNHDDLRNMNTMNGK